MGIASMRFMADGGAGAGEFIDKQDIRSVFISPRHRILGMKGDID